MPFTILIKDSNVLNKVPALADLADGELALNKNEDSPALYMRAGTNIVKLGPDFIGDTYPTLIGGPGPSKGEAWYDPVNNLLRFYDGADWNIANKGVHLSATPPVDVSPGDLWVNLTGPVPTLFIWDGATFIGLITVGSTVTVTELGAIGDGNPANAPGNVLALQNAVNAVAASTTQNEILIPPGIYYFDAPIKIPQMPETGITIRGSGPDTILRFHEDFPTVENYFDLTGTPQTLVPALFMSIADQRNLPGLGQPQLNMVFENFAVEGTDFELNGGDASVFLLNGFWRGSAIRRVRAKTVTNVARIAASRDFVIEECDFEGNLAQQRTGLFFGVSTDPLAEDAVPSVNAIIEGLTEQVENAHLSKNQIGKWIYGLHADHVQGLSSNNDSYYISSVGVLLDENARGFSFDGCTFKDCYNNINPVAVDGGIVLGVDPPVIVDNVPEGGSIQSCVFSRSHAKFVGANHVIFDGNNMVTLASVPLFVGPSQLQIISNALPLVRNTFGSVDELTTLNRAEVITRSGALGNVYNNYEAPADPLAADFLVWDDVAKTWVPLSAYSGGAGSGPAGVDIGEFLVWNGSGWSSSAALVPESAYPVLADPFNPLPGQEQEQVATVGYVHDRAQDAIDSAAPIGVIQMYAGNTAPTDWLLCDGSSLSTATYPALFAVLSYTYGGAGGSFNLPDLRAKFPLGEGTGAVATYNRGDYSGFEEHTLTIGEMPGHNHGGGGSSGSAGSHGHTITVNSGGAHTHTGTASTGGSHSHSGSTNSTGSHTHSYLRPDNQEGPVKFNPSGGFDDTQRTPDTTGSAGTHSHTVTINSGGSHSHSVTINSGGSHAHTASASTAASHQHTYVVTAQGGGAPHNNMPPYCVVNYIIKAEVT